MNLLKNDEVKSLPPNVKGKCRGTLEISLKQIDWKKSAKIFVGVCAKVNWWGESSSIGSIIKLDDSRKKTKKTITYKILTNSALFHQYIRSCEPIEIKFSSAISNLQIGTSFIPIPIEIINYFSVDSKNSTNPLNCLSPSSFIHQTVQPIFSPKKNIILGTISIYFKINLFATKIMVSPNILNSRAERDNSSIIITSVRSNKTNMESKTGSIDTVIISEISKQIGAPKTQLHESKKKNVLLQYLSGRDMTKDQEMLALNEIRTVSPSESVIEAVSGGTIKSSHSTVDTKLLASIDSIRITVMNFTPTNAGVREAIGSITDSQARCGIRSNVSIECKPNPCLFRCRGGVKYKSDFNSIRFSADALIAYDSKIDFNEERITSIQIPRLENTYNDVANMTFMIYIREFGTNVARILGTTTVYIDNILNSVNLSMSKKCAVISHVGHILIGTLTVKLELGCRGLHFGSDFFDAINYYNKENMLLEENYDINSLACSSKSNTISSKYEKQNIQCFGSKLVQQVDSSKCCNQDKQDAATTSETSSSSATTTSSTIVTDAQITQQSVTNNFSESNTKDNPQISIDPSDDKSLECPIVLHGLFYIGSIFYAQEQQDSVETFVIGKSFWKDQVSVTNMAENDSFNYLETFSILKDEVSSRTNNQTLDIDMWQKNVNSSEQKVGITKIPLNQFHQTFGDQSSYTTENKFPVFSIIDGWAFFVAPLSGEQVAKIQVVLALGTAEQIELFKANRGFSRDDISEKDILKIKIPIPLTKNPNPTPSPSLNNAGTQTNFSASTESDSETQAATKQSFSGQRLQNSQNTMSMLNNFIETLASRLPKEPVTEVLPPSDSVYTIHQPQNILQTKLTESAPPQNIPIMQQQQPQIRRTSDLLDVLQRALMCAPNSVPASTVFLQPMQNEETPAQIQTEGDENSENISEKSNPPIQQPQFQVLIEIENALHISKISIKINKKCGKQRGRSKNQTFRGVQEVEPSTYVTFEANGLATNVVHSPEGPVYTTNVFEKSCNPQWNKRFEVFLPIDLLTNDEKGFILKVWRKASTDIPQARLLPNPTEDVVIGFSSIDLSVLLAGMPTISGWYNILDYSGKVNGQIKINIQPMEDLSKYEVTDENSLSNVNSLLNPLSIDVDNGEFNGSTVLSRTLKRKFTELEEITQRLKARLFDITGDPTVDPDDEFERDLNTNPNEDEEVDACFSEGMSSNFDWMHSNENLSDRCEEQLTNKSITFAGQANQFQNYMASATNNSAFIASKHDAISTMYTNANQLKPENAAFTLDSLIKDHDIDTLINPNIFNRLINPCHLSTSDDSTPRDLLQLVVDQEQNKEIAQDAANSNDDSVDSNCSSNSSSEQERIRIISNALQKAVITDETSVQQPQNRSSLERKAPEGGTTSSCTSNN